MTRDSLNPTWQWDYPILTLSPPITTLNLICRISSFILFLSFNHNQNSIFSALQLISMAATSLHSLPYLRPLHLHRRRFHRHFPSSPITLTLSSSSATTSSPILTFDSLAAHLSASDFRRADDETRRLLISIAGEAAQKRGYVYFSEVQFIATDDLKAIDELWRRHSDGRFGYSVQKRLWEKSRRDFTRFFINVGWMRRMETEVEQFTYRSFPGEFRWDLADDTPEGHLPLTNALRGTQLLVSILTHPAFKTEGEEAAQGIEESGEKEKTIKDLSSRRLVNPDYSF